MQSIQKRWLVKWLIGIILLLIVGHVHSNDRELEIAVEEAKKKGDIEAKNVKIDFHGLLLDQYGTPVPNAEISFALDYHSWRLFGQSIGLGRRLVTGVTSNEGKFRIKEKGTALYLEEMWREGYDPDRMGQPLYALKFADPGSVKGYESTADQPQIFFMWKYYPDDILTYNDASVGGIVKGPTYTYFNAWRPYDIVAKDDELPDYVHAKGYDYKPDPIDTGDLWLLASKTDEPELVSLKIQVPNGGVQFYTDVLDLIAPEDGYEDSTEIKLKIGDFSSQAFIFTRKKAQDNKYIYARYDLRNVEVDYSDNSENVKFRIHLYQYANPYGSPNLEHNRNNGFTEKELGEMRKFRERIAEVEKKQGDKAADEYWIRASQEIIERRKREKEERYKRSKRILPEVFELEKKRLAFKPIMEAILAGNPLPPGYTPGSPIPGYKAQAQAPSESVIQKDQPPSTPEGEKIHKPTHPIWLFFGILGFVVLVIVVFILIVRRKKQS